MRCISKENIQKIIAVLLSEGKESVLTQFNLSEETFNRYMRKAKEYGITTVDRGKIIAQIIQNYTDKELEAIAKGGRIVPGYAKVPIISFEGKRIRVGAITDTHIGSVDFHEERLYQSFDEFKKAKVDFIVHAGDVLEGMSNRPGHIYELTHLGYEQQKNYSVSLLSQWTDTDIYAISGNHDRWYVKSAGANALADISKEVKNFHFLGHDEGEISLDGKAVLRLWHGEDSSSYALCVDDKTEIFTENGWKLFKDLAHNEMVATLNPDSNSFEFQFPTDYVIRDYNGEMISFQGQKYDMVVTPDHRMWVRREWNNKWEFIYAKNITKGRQWKINRVIPEWNGLNADVIFLPPPSKRKRGVCTNYVNKVDIKLWAEFVGWMLSEGNISHANQRVEISQSSKINNVKCDRIIDLIKKMGFTCYQSEKKISISSKQLYEIFKDMGHSHEKSIQSILKNANKDVLLSLLNGLFLGDGTFKNGKYQNYTTNSQQLADDVQEILLKCGISAVIKKYGNRKSNFNQTRPIYQISCSYNMTEPGLWTNPTAIPYNGKVYCVSVPNQIILVRRNGKVAWTGNSYRLQKILESLTGGEKPNAMIVGHVHKYVDIFERHVLCTSIGCIQSQTRWMRSKRISAHPGFAIIDYYVNASGICSKTSTWNPFYS